MKFLKKKLKLGKKTISALNDLEAMQFKGGSVYETDDCGPVNTGGWHIGRSTDHGATCASCACTGTAHESYTC